MTLTYISDELYLHSSYFSNVILDDKSKEDEDEKAGTPDGKPEAATPTGKRKKDKDSKDSKEKSRKPSAGKPSKSLGRRGSGAAMTTPPPGGAHTPGGSDVDGQRLALIILMFHRQSWFPALMLLGHYLGLTLHYYILLLTV